MWNAIFVLGYIVALGVVLYFLFVRRHAVEETKEAIKGLNEDARKLYDKAKTVVKK